jgi:flavodoxin
MKVLVAYYSRTGVTRLAAQEIARRVGADIDEITDTKPRGGVVGWVVAGKDALLKRPTQIKPVSKDPAAYELVIIGTPVWAFTMAPAIRTYIIKYRRAFRKVAFFCTMGGSGDARTFRHMTHLAGMTPAGTLALMERDVRSNRHGAQVEKFAEQLAGV